jgi:hypothetical protein
VRLARICRERERPVPWILAGAGSLRVPGAWAPATRVPLPTAAMRNCHPLVRDRFHLHRPFHRRLRATPHQRSALPTSAASPAWQPRRTRPARPGQIRASSATRFHKSQTGPASPGSRLDIPVGCTRRRGIRPVHGGRRAAAASARAAFDAGRSGSFRRGIRHIHPIAVRATVALEEPRSPTWQPPEPYRGSRLAIGPRPRTGRPW